MELSNMCIWLVWSMLLLLGSDACSPPVGPPMPLVQNTYFYDVIFVGSVLRTFPDHRYNYGADTDVYTAEMEVHCIYKGEPLADVVNVTGAGFIPGHCHSNELEVGKDFVVLADYGNDEMQVGMEHEIHPAEAGPTSNLNEILHACHLTHVAPIGGEVTSTLEAHLCPKPANADNCFPKSDHDSGDGYGNPPSGGSNMPAYAISFSQHGDDDHHHTNDHDGDGDHDHDDHHAHDQDDDADHDDSDHHTEEDHNMDGIHDDSDHEHNVHGDDGDEDHDGDGDHDDQDHHVMDHDHDGDGDHDDSDHHDYEHSDIDHDGDGDHDEDDHHFHDDHDHNKDGVHDDADHHSHGDHDHDGDGQDDHHDDHEHEHGEAHSGSGTAIAGLLLVTVSTLLNLAAATTQTQTAI